MNIQDRLKITIALLVALSIIVTVLCFLSLHQALVSQPFTYLPPGTQVHEIEVVREMSKSTCESSSKDGSTLSGDHEEYASHKERTIIVPKPVGPHFAGTE